MKQRFKIKESIIMIAAVFYVCIITAFDFMFLSTGITLHSDFLALFISVVSLILTFSFCKSEKKNIILPTAVFLFTSVGTGALFLFYGVFQSYRLLLLIPSLLLLMFYYRGMKKIISVSFSVILYISVVFVTLMLPDLVVEYTPEVSLSVQFLTFTVAVVFVLFYASLFTDKKNLPANQNKNVKNYSEADILLCIYFHNPEEVKKKIGVFNFCKIYEKIEIYLNKFTDDYTQVMAYGGERFMFFFRNRDEDFISELADGMVLSLNDELKIDEPLLVCWNIYKRNPDEDITTAIRNADNI